MPGYLLRNIKVESLLILAGNRVINKLFMILALLCFSSNFMEFLKEFLLLLDLLKLPHISLLT